MPDLTPGGSILPPSLLRSRRIGPYRLLDRLGEGGMGMVFLVEDVRDGSRCAMKVLLGRDLSSEVDRERFVQEARAIGRVQHPNIVSLLDAGSQEDIDYLCMSYIEGLTLDNWIAETRPNSKAIARVIEQVCRGLQAVHDAGLLHRDIKPQNILVDRSGTAYLTDFGLARDLVDPGGLTQRSQTLGTPAYMAPEQAMNAADHYGPWTDIWSVGVVLYEALSGNKPFVGASLAEVFRQIVEEDPRRLSQGTSSSAIDLSLVAIVSCCLEKDHHRRYESAKELADDLARYQHSSRVVARSPGVLRSMRRFRRRHRFALAITVAICLVSAVWGGAALWQWRKTWEGWVPVVDWQAGQPLPAQIQFFSGDLVDRLGLDHRLQEEGLIINPPRPRGQGSDWLVLQAAGIDDGLRLRLEVHHGSIEPEEIEFIIGPAIRDTGNKWARPDGRRIGVFWEEGVGRVEVGEYRGIGDEDAELIARGAGLRPEARSIIDLIVANGSIMVAIDGRQVCRQDRILLRDHEPTLVIRACRGTTRIESLRLHHLARPEHASPVIAADALLRAGLHERALLAYEAIADGHRERAAGEEALAKACALALLRVPEALDRGQALLERFRQEYPSSRFLSRLALVEIESAWLRGNHLAALDQLEAELERQPDCQLAWRLVQLNEDRGPPTAGAGDRLLRLLMRRPGPLQRLTIRELGITDLAPLAGRQIRSLDCSGNPLVSLHGLETASVSNLICRRTAMVDLSGIPTSGLLTVDCSDSQIRDIGALRAASDLKRLIIENTEVMDLAALAGGSLRILECSYSAVTALPELSALEKLWCRATAIGSLEPVARSPLTELSLSGSAITDLSPLRGKPIEWIDVSHTDVQDLHPVAGPVLRFLGLSGTSITSLEALAGATALQEIDCSDSAVTDLSGLAGLSLQRADLSGSQVRDLRPLADHPLTLLQVENAPIVEFGPFLDRPPAVFNFFSEGIVGDRLETLAVRWQETRPELARVARLHRRLQVLPPGRWFLEAVDGPGGRYLVIPRLMTLGEVRGLAGALGAEIPRFEWAISQSWLSPLGIQERLLCRVELGTKKNAVGTIRPDFDVVAGSDRDRGWGLLFWPRRDLDEGPRRSSRDPVAAD